MEGTSTSKHSDREASRIQINYILVGSILGAVINVTYFVGWRFGGFYPEFLPTINLVHLLPSISSQNVMVAFFAALISTYVGLWLIGKVKLESSTKGIRIGLRVTLFSVPVIAALQFALYLLYPIPIEFFLSLLASSLIAVILENVIGCLLGGFFGGILVKFVAPDYCPKCGAKLSAGIICCPQCGWGRVE